MPPPTSS
ncbi:unnamed protein product, partial [Rotaria sordida]